MSWRQILLVVAFVAFGWAIWPLNWPHFLVAVASFVCFGVLVLLAIDRILMDKEAECEDWHRRW